MLNQFYAIEAFQAKFSELKTIKSLKDFIKSDPRLELLVRIVLPDLTWNAGDDTTMESKAHIYPKIMISGETYEFCSEFELKSLLGLEGAYLNALKQVVKLLPNLKS